MNSHTRQQDSIPYNQQDLNWLLNSEPLLNISDTEATIQLWQAGITTPTAPIECLPHRDDYRRLGLYAEQLFASYCLSDSTPISLLTRNLQILDAKQKVTQGELDFVVEDNHGELSHIEMAVKFYLYDQASQEFIGPNAKDRLLKKLARLFEHQLPLSDTPEAKTLLHQVFQERSQQRFQIQQHLKKRLLLKGSLFRHIAEQQSTAALCAHFNDRNPFKATINPDVEWGLWCHRHEWDEYAASHKNAYTIAPFSRLDWLAGDQDKAIAANNSLLETPFLPKMFAFYNRKSSALTRVMVVENDWPNIT